MSRRWLSLAVVLWAAPAWADEPAAASQARLLKDLTYLTSDECEGRGIWTKGIHLAADHIAREFAKAGLKPVGDRGSYFQHFHVTAGARVDKPATLVLTGPLGQTMALEMDKGFSVLRSSGSATAEGGLVFVGYGRTSAKHGYDDYAGLDVKGKVVVVLRRQPRALSPAADPLTTDRHHDAADTNDDVKVANAEAHGAAAVLLVNAADVTTPAGPRQTAVRGDTLTPSPRGGTVRAGAEPLFVSPVHAATVPVVQIKRQLLDSLLRSVGDDLASVEKDIDRAYAPKSRPLAGWTCRVETAVTHSRVQVKNVVGVLEGSGPLADETVVVGAHYDHVGYGMAMPFRRVSGFGDIGAFGMPSLRAGSRLIHHGADDNASGTVSVVELARRLGTSPNREGRRVVFMAFTAEESGLYGSAYYGGHPIYPLEKTAAMLNMDMVGRLQDDHIEVTGVGTAKGLEAMVDRILTKHGLKATKVRTGFGPSDHESFARRGIPAMELFTGFHEQYHMPTDRVETIDVHGLRRVVDFAQDIVAEWRNVPKPEYVRVVESYHRGTALWALSSAFGVIPHPSDHANGVLIQEVMPDTPAARGGLAAGDRIVALGGQAATDLTAYLQAVRRLPAGTDVDVFVLRSGKPAKLVVPLTRLNVAQTATQFGIVADPAFKDMLKVQRVTPNSTAAQGGLQAGDRIVALAGKAGTGIDMMRHLLGFNPDDEVDVTYERDGKSQTRKVRLAFDPTGSLGRATLTPMNTVYPGLVALGIEPNLSGSIESVQVHSVRAGSPAAKAGLKVGDRIAEVGGKKVQGIPDLATRFGSAKPGATFDLTVQRQQGLSPQKWDTHKMQVVLVGTARQMGVSVALGGRNGARVTRVADNSEAAKGGLKVDDQITAIAGKAVQSAEDYMNVLSSHKEGDTVEMTVQRGGQAVTLKMLLKLSESGATP